jgi:FixJ family two-component response regulator
MIVGSKNTCDHLISLLPSGQMEVLQARNCRQAQRFLRSRPNLAVVMTEMTLPDGTWSDLLDDVFLCGSRAAVIVISPFAGAGVWADVLWSGAQDLLVEPFGAWELRRAVESALRAVMGNGILAAAKPEASHSGSPTVYPMQPLAAKGSVSGTR